MTLRIPMQIVLGLLFLMASWGGAFGIAVAVVEWRGDGAKASEYVGCTNDALQKNVDQWKEHRAIRPVSPDSPGAGASSAAYDAYRQQWTQYEKDYENWVDRGDEFSAEYDEAVRACGELVD